MCVLQIFPPSSSLAFKFFLTMAFEGSMFYILTELISYPYLQLLLSGIGGATTVT